MVDVEATRFMWRESWLGQRCPELALVSRTACTGGQPISPSWTRGLGGEERLTECRVLFRHSVSEAKVAQSPPLPLGTSQDICVPDFRS